MPWSMTVVVSCVSALSVRRTLIDSEVSSVHADQRFAPLAAAPTLPCGEPERLAERYCPSQPPPDFGPQSIAAFAYVSTTCQRGLAGPARPPGATWPHGDPPFRGPAGGDRPAPR